MVLPYQALKKILFGAQPMIVAETPVEPSQIQPASCDLRLGDTVYCMKAAGFPGKKETVRQFVENNCHRSFVLGNTPCVLEKGHCYIIPLKERLRLGTRFFATFSPKSSIGRCDIFVRVLSDKNPSYDKTPKGYHGPLYLEIVPLSFRARVVSRLSLVQMRIQEDDATADNATLEALQAEYGIVRDSRGRALGLREARIQNNAVYFSIDLSRKIVGFEAVPKPRKELFLNKPKSHIVSDFWRRIRRPSSRKEIVLAAGKFYLLSTKERVIIPPGYCAEVIHYEVTTGEFRTHYAGFFDPGFGGKQGTTLVLEVRVRDAAFRFFDGQVICGMVFRKTKEPSEILYGQELGSHYTGSGPSLSKYFKENGTAWR
ncbi:MAG: hypothetical protein A3G11_00510 [Candidatus Lloydbacteria bacterium RIFCSPLOWO2_12_FULL_51_9]|uniref:2'-deoxycytidine 5'-triphosphate deaminase n=2 Tax=Candidatus Lloydiibacteriota TaxID=1817910 RepID=A0A1G2DR81_9BACT|nr:MAG: hypothetical protein A3J08_03635 [Candidatus Lloydbacteria bacterium RIFCSPLOWO2_02_FULL_51_11]OGZ16145.1 MAG: hypothetical protein A3G11_00510 [Candidatus Lloydbacteria bacterium RIFCSPLOWO2_12_FULL_51_9]